MSRPAPKIELSAEEKETLLHWMRSTKTVCRRRSCGCGFLKRLLRSDQLKTSATIAGGHLQGGKERRSDALGDPMETLLELRDFLDQRKLMAPGGTWWLYVQQWVAVRDNDQARLAELKPALDELEKERQAWLATARAMFAK